MNSLWEKFWEIFKNGVAVLEMILDTNLHLVTTVLTVLSIDNYSFRVVGWILTSGRCCLCGVSRFPGICLSLLQFQGASRCEQVVTSPVLYAVLLGLALDSPPDSQDKAVTES